MSKTEQPTAQRTSPRQVGYCQSPSPESVELTVYQQGGMAVVREQRRVALSSGINQLYLEGLPTQYQLNSLIVLDYEGKGKLTLGPVTYRPANLDKARILLGSVDTRVMVKEFATNGRVSNISGTLKAVIGNELVVERNDNHRLMLVPATHVELESLPPGLSSTPSLMMLPTASSEGSYKLGLLYEAGGLAWMARYSAFYDEKANKLSRLDATVTVTNQSGARFHDARVQLLAGANYGSNYGHGMLEGAVRMSAMAAPAGGARRKHAFVNDEAQVESIGEVKAYELPERITISDGDTQQVTLFQTLNVPVKREFFLTAGGYYNRGTDQAEKLPVHIRLRGENARGSNLGKALPAGEVSILQADGDGSQQKTFTSSLVATSEGEAFKLEFGPSADIKAERVLVEVTDTKEEVKPAPSFPIKPQGPMLAGGPNVGRPGQQPDFISEGPHFDVAAPADSDEEPAEYREELRQITLYNYKTEGVDVIVNEQLPDNAEILNQPEGYSFARTAGDAHLTVKIGAKNKTVLKYRLRYRTN